MNPPMINQCVFFLTLFLILSSTTAVVNYDYSRLVLQWPRSYCTIMKDIGSPCTDINQVPALFTVHGLWPDLLDGKGVLDPSKGDCPSTVKFDPNTLAPEVKLRATIAWPDIQYYTKKGTVATAIFNGHFWERQWKKHGVCSNLQPNQYMALVLLCYDILLPQISHARGELPEPRSPVDVAKFRNEIKAASEVIPRLICKFLSGNQQILHEIQFNVSNVYPYKLQDMEQGTNCLSSSQVLFPQ